jgi:methionyl-tRNA formyltransferase
VTTRRARDPRARTVFVGSGPFGRESLRRLANHDAAELVGVVTAPPRPAGRGQQPTASIIAGLANELGVEPLLTPAKLRDPVAVGAVLALEPELLVLADYGQIVPPDLLKLKHGALNLHPSLLPRHRGATPIPAAILAGDAETGVTLMRMDAGLDTGPIVAEERIATDGTETAPQLEARLELVAGRLLERNVGPWIRGELKARPQPETGATMTRPFRRADGRLDPDAPVVELERRIRALQPWPGSWVETVAGRLTIWRAEAVPGWETGDAAQPGIFGRFGLHARDGYLALREVQPAGGRRMTFEELVRGRPAIVGSSVVRDAAA